ncbi:MAG: phage tail protein [Planctomycetia bacterium]
MPTNSGQLVQALIDGGLQPAAARVIANALANADSPAFSNARDVQDATPTDQLRMVTSDTRKYLLTNLDYSREPPYQARLRSSPGRYELPTADHPYKDSQPVTPVPPLSTPTVTGGKYVEVESGVQDGAPTAAVSLSFGTVSGTHLRIRPATNSLEAVPLTVSAPQALVTASVDEQATATNIEIAVRGLNSRAVVLSDGSTAQVLVWGKSATPPAQSITPTGAIMAFAYSLPESGWLLCDGRAVSRTTFAALFGAIATYYGAGDGSTTFNIPDLRGYFIRGFGTNSDGTVSGTFGAKTDFATARPTTALTGTTNSTGSHRHGIQISFTASGAGYSYESGNSINENPGAYTLFDGTHSHTVTIDGGGDAETRPKNIALPYYIKT